MSTNLPHALLKSKKIYTKLKNEVPNLLRLNFGMSKNSHFASGCIVEGSVRTVTCCPQNNDSSNAHVKDTIIFGNNEIKEGAEFFLCYSR